MVHRKAWRGRRKDGRGERGLASEMNRRDFFRRSTGAAIGGGVAVGLGHEAFGAFSGAHHSRLELLNQTTGEAQILFHSGIYGDPSSFDWNLDPSCGAEEATFAGLLTLDEHLRPVPDWAEHFESNADATMWTFQIRLNNRGWTDGEPVTAHDFVWSWTRRLDPANASPHAGYFFDIKYAEQFNTSTPVDDPNDPMHDRVPTAADLGVKALDDWTLEVTTAGPCAYFPAIAAAQATVPAPRWQVERHGDAWAKGGDVPIVSNGPFKVDHWEPGVKIELSRNEDYWNANNVRLARVVMPIMAAGENNQLYADGSNDRRLDWTKLDATQYEGYLADPALSQQMQPYVDQAIWMLLPQVTIAPFDQVAVRQALSHSLDRQRIADATRGLAVPAWCMAPPGMFGHLDEPSLQDIQRVDPQQSMALLVGTPYEDGEGWPEIIMYLPEEEDGDVAGVMANEIVAQLKENLRMDVRLETVAASDFSTHLQKLEWPLVLAPWRYERADPHNGYGDMFYSRRDAGKRQAWSNAAFDDLVVAGRAEPDQAKRLEIYLQAERIIQEDVGYVPLVYRQVMNVFKPWVKGVGVNAHGYAVPDGDLYVRMLTRAYIEGRETE